MLQRYLRDCVSLVSNDSDSEGNYNVYNGGRPFEDSAESCNVVHCAKSGKSTRLLKTAATMDSLQFYYLFGSCSEASDDELRREKVAHQKNQKQKKQVKRQDSRGKMQVKKQDSRSKLIACAKDAENFVNYQEKKQTQQSCMKQQEKIVQQNRSKGVDAKMQDTSVSKNMKTDETQGKSTVRKAPSRSMSYNVGRTSGYELLKRRFFKGDSKKIVANDKNLPKENVISTIVEPSKGEEHAHVLQHSQTMPKPLDQDPTAAAKVVVPELQSQELLDVPKAQSPFTKVNNVDQEKLETEKIIPNIEFTKSTPNIVSRDDSVFDLSKSSKKLPQIQPDQTPQTVIQNKGAVQDSVASASPRTPIGKIDREQSSGESKKTSDFGSVATPIQNFNQEDSQNNVVIDENLNSSKNLNTEVLKNDSKNDANLNLKDAKNDVNKDAKLNLKEAKISSQMNSFKSQHESNFGTSKKEQLEVPTKIVTKFHTSPENQKSEDKNIGAVGKISKASQMFENKAKFLSKVGSENQKSTPSRMTPQSPNPSRAFVTKAATFANKDVQPKIQPQVTQLKQDTSSKKKLAGLIARFEAAN